MEEIKTKHKVCVLGAGVIGLSSAVRIQDSFPNLDITIVADKFSPNTTSDGSAGFWGPHLVNDDQKEDIIKWGKETFDHIMGLVNSVDGGELGAQLISGFNFSKEIIEKDPFWKDQVISYRKLTAREKKHHPSNKDYVSYSTVMIDVKSYLPWLMKKFLLRGGRVKQQNISSLSQIAENFEIIINCVGIGAKQLLNDGDVTPIRGQIIRVVAPWVKHFYKDFDPDQNTEIYVLPGRDFVTLGGTSQEGNWNTDVNKEDQTRIWESCVRLVPSLQKARKVEDWVGLRPQRLKVRLELQKYQDNMVIHNYGHSGSGVTLHWGCAGNVVQLLKSALSKSALSSRL